MSHDLNNTCSTCHYWTGDKNKKVGDGQCHRFPPQAAGIIPQQNPITRQTIPAVLSAFPSCAAGEWCGEWQPEKVILQ